MEKLGFWISVGFILLVLAILGFAIFQALDIALLTAQHKR